MNDVTVSRNFEFSAAQLALNKEISAPGGKFNVQMAAMALSMLMIDANTDRLQTQLQGSTNNLNKLTAMNQLKEDTTGLKGLRANAGKKDTDTMESNSADCKNLMDKAMKAGVTISADEYSKWSSGKMTAADIDTLDSRIKTMQDTASNQSQADNMQMQKHNTLSGQSTNMGMTFLEEYKKSSERIFR